MSGGAGRAAGRVKAAFTPAVPPRARRHRQQLCLLGAGGTAAPAQRPPAPVRGTGPPRRASARPFPPLPGSARPPGGFQAAERGVKARDSRGGGGAPSPPASTGRRGSLLGLQQNEPPLPALEAPRGRAAWGWHRRPPPPRVLSPRAWRRGRAGRRRAAGRTPGAAAEQKAGPEPEGTRPCSQSPLSPGPPQQTGLAGGAARPEGGGEAALQKSGRAAEPPPSGLKLKQLACRSDPPPLSGPARPGGLRPPAPAREGSPGPLPPARRAGLRRSWRRAGRGEVHFR